MKIAIDLQGAQTDSRFRGIGRYVLSLVDAMIALGRHDIHLVLNGTLTDSIESIRGHFADIIGEDHIHVWYAVAPFPHLDTAFSAQRQAAEAIREAFIAGLNPDIILITSLFEGFGDNAVQTVATGPSAPPTAIIQYDLIPLLNPDQYFRGNERYESCYREAFSHIKQAAVLLCISNSARQEIQQIPHLGPLPAENIGAAVDDRFHPVTTDAETTTSTFTRLGITRPFIMYSGASDERKNHLRLIKAYASLPMSIRLKHQLVLAGIIPDENREKFRKAIRENGLSPDEVRITGRIDDRDMVLLYNTTKLYVFPSWHEGFGLPLLEAMSCGAPAIASNKTSMPEIVGREDALFDPLDVDSICKKIRQALEDDGWRAELAATGLKQAKLFSWPESARKAFDALELAASRTKLRRTQVKPDDRLQTLITRLMSVPGLPQDDAFLLKLAKALNNTFPLPRKRQLLLDVSELIHVDARTGVQRVVRSLLKRFLSHPPKNFDVRPVYATQHGYGYRYAKDIVKRLEGGALPPSDNDVPVEITKGDIFFGLDLQHHVVIRHEELYAEWRRMGVKVVFLLHDLLPVLMPNVFREEMYDLHSQWLRVLAEGDGIISVSKSVMTELKTWLEGSKVSRSRPLKLGWSHSGADIEDSHPSKGVSAEARTRLDNLQPGTHFLAIGTIEPRKNHKQLLDAFDRLWDAGVPVNLIIVGKIGWHVEEVTARLRTHHRLNRNLFWLEQTSDEFLEQIFEKADCLIVPSLGEGFGLPIIEAARHGLPLLLRDLPVFKEVAGESALYFSGFTPQALADAVIVWLAHNKANTLPTSRSIKWQTWAASYKALCAILVDEQWQDEWYPET